MNMKFLNFRQDLRFYSVREYGVMGLSALLAGLVIALMLNAASGGSATDEGGTLRRASMTQPAPAVNFAVVEHVRDVRVAQAAARASIVAWRHAHQVRVNARARARAASARLAAARVRPHAAPKQTTAVRRPTYVAPAPSPAPVYKPTPQRSTGTAEKKGSGSLQFDDSG
jgi:hypothetical protein